MTLEQQPTTPATPAAPTVVHITRENTWFSLGLVVAIMGAELALIVTVLSMRTEVRGLRTDVAHWVDVVRAMHPEFGLPPLGKADER